MAVLGVPRMAEERKTAEAEVLRRTKRALVIRNGKAGEMASLFLREMANMKKPHSVVQRWKRFSSAFCDAGQIEAACKRSDASLFVAGASRKGKDTVVFGRLFSETVSTLVEVSLKSVSPTVHSYRHGARPVFVFSGEETEEHALFKNVLVDLLNKNKPAEVSLGGLELVVSVSFRGKEASLKTYLIEADREGGFSNTGGSLKMRDISLKKTGFEAVLCVEKSWVSAVNTVPRRKKKDKRERDEIGNVYGRVHVGRQEVEKIRPRKMKAFGH
ncbi:MAG: Brix-domain-containing protein [Amphiamblys sp. WSBS2006]|nr:MAG: Brix-domain-containing protein [Amphiamblys sp. WSBS2006]